MEQGANLWVAIVAFITTGVPAICAVILGWKNRCTLQEIQRRLKERQEELELEKKVAAELAAAEKETGK